MTCAHTRRVQGQRPSFSRRRSKLAVSTSMMTMLASPPVALAAVATRASYVPASSQRKALVCASSAASPTAATKHAKAPRRNCLRARAVCVEAIGKSRWGREDYNISTELRVPSCELRREWIGALGGRGCFRDLGPESEDRFDRYSQRARELQREQHGRDHAAGFDGVHRAPGYAGERGQVGLGEIPHSALDFQRIAERVAQRCFIHRATPGRSIGTG